MGSKFSGSRIFSGAFHESLHAVRQLAAAEHHPALAGQTFQPDIRPETDDLPLVPATGVHLAQSHDVTDLIVRDHKGIISHVIIVKIQLPRVKANMLNLSPSVLISRLLILVIALSFHEFMHAFVADRLGDDTPRRMGRLTLNPLAHLDPIGSLMLILVGFGWAKPVQVNAYNLKQNSSAGMMWVSLAGPGANLLLAILGAIPLRFGLVPLVAGSGILPSMGEFLFTFVSINLLLMIFNLIPVAPLDGEKILEFFLPETWANSYAKFQTYGPIVLMALIFLLPLVGIDLIGSIMNPALISLRQLLIGV